MTAGASICVMGLAIGQAGFAAERAGRSSTDRKAVKHAMISEQLRANGQKAGKGEKSPASLEGVKSRRAADLDVLKRFADPPPGYGEVPFYWFVGDPLTKERLTWQLDELHSKGVSGVQLNFPHSVGGGGGFGAPYPADPPLFSEKWWELWRWLTGECRKRGMGIGVSDYVLAWPGNGAWVDEVIALPGLQGSVLSSQASRAEHGRPVAMELPENLLSVMAYPVKNGALDGASAVDLRPFVTGRSLTWEVPAGEWQVTAVSYEVNPSSIDPMNPEVGKEITKRFFQRFEDHTPGRDRKGLNYFFQDELMFGVYGNLWTKRFAEEFQRRKGYDLIPYLPALFADIGPVTPKIRLDYSDVKAALTEEGYFRPIFDWNATRGMIYGCDQAGRGLDPAEFGDYFRCVRWFTAPGHDTPGVGADLLKGKVSSSISHLYHRPRVWLEGYHSAGWGMTPAALMQATRENYVFGCNLLCLHGLYYTTHGGFWEWAPPCYHFRMPYWQHMGVFLKYFERLSYLLSQGDHRCDVAVMYPVAPLEAGMDGERSVSTAFTMGAGLFGQGIDFDFIDFQSLERAKFQGKQLLVSGEAYRVLVLPAMAAVRWSTIQQALRFFRSGGIVIATGRLPEVSDRAGRHDPRLDAAVREIFGLASNETEAGKVPTPQTNAAGGLGVFIAEKNDGQAIVGQVKQVVDRSIPRDFVPEGGAYVLHRKIDRRDVYMVVNAAKGSECFFRAKGKAEFWDPWTGTTRPVYTSTETTDGTKVRMPLDGGEAPVIVFSPGDPGPAVEKTDVDAITGINAEAGSVTLTGFCETGGRKSASVRLGGQVARLEGEAPIPPPPVTLDGLWEFELRPTLDNRFGDFRLPVAERMIGAEARQFRYADEVEPNQNWDDPKLDDSGWQTITCSFGPRLWQLGPLSGDDDTSAIEQTLLGLDSVDPEQPLAVRGKQYPWKPYDYSLRWGMEGDPGEQGYHGLKERVTDAFLRFEPKTYFWTTVSSPEAGPAKVLTGNAKPAAVWLNGAPIPPSSEIVELKRGVNRLLVRYDTAGRDYFVLQSADAPAGETDYPLAMSWYREAGILAFDPRPTGGPHIGWYRFTAPPGLRSMRFAIFGRLLGAWAEGKDMRVEPGARRSDGLQEYRAEVVRPAPGMVNVALRIEQEAGCYGGSALPEPISLDCGKGQIPLGDWSRMGVLAAYSGGAVYRRKVTLSAEQTQGRVTLELGEVAATAEVRVNAKPAGIRVAPPWRLDISKLVKPGENEIVILVFNTLANHYSTIPTNYRGSPLSGLLGPVRIETAVPVVLRARLGERGGR